MNAGTYFVFDIVGTRRSVRPFPCGKGRSPWSGCNMMLCLGISEFCGPCVRPFAGVALGRFFVWMCLHLPCPHVGPAHRLRVICVSYQRERWLPRLRLQLSLTWCYYRCLAVHAKTYFSRPRVDTRKRCRENYGTFENSSCSEQHWLMGVPLEAATAEPEHA